MLFLLQKNSVNWLYSKFLEILIYPSIWVAGGIASLGFYVENVLNLPLDWQAPALIFAAALVFYNLDRIFDSYVQKIPDRKVQSFFRNRLIFLLLLVSVLATASLLFIAPQQVRLVSLAGLIPLLYGMPLLPVRQDRSTKWYRLKDIPGIKAWLVSGTLTYAVVALPLAYSNASFDTRAILVTLFLFVFISTNSHLFDFRDLKSDRHEGVLTLPLIIGTSKTRIFFTVLNSLVLLVVSWYWMSGLVVPTPIIIVAIVAIDLAIVWLLRPETPRNVYNIWIDGCLFLPQLLTNL